MNSTQRNILIRLGSMSFLMMIAYVLLIAYVRSTFDHANFVDFVIIISAIYIGLLSLLWFREKNLYSDYMMQRRINSGQIEYMLCPKCKAIQVKGIRQCTFCKEVWIICKACQIPFEDGSQVLISPCCGEGFHYDHFETALRELSSCPYCGSDLALKTTNW